MDHFIATGEVIINNREPELEILGSARMTSPVLLKAALLAHVKHKNPGARVSVRIQSVLPVSQKEYFARMPRFADRLQG